jgi:hypothetical protein
MCSIIGLLAMGIMGLGMLLVRGRRRVPNPPAIIKAFTGSSLSYARFYALIYGLEGFTVKIFLGS